MTILTNTQNSSFEQSADLENGDLLLASFAPRAARPSRDGWYARDFLRRRTDALLCSAVSNSPFLTGLSLPKGLWREFVSTELACSRAAAKLDARFWAVVEGHGDEAECARLRSATAETALQSVLRLRCYDEETVVPVLLLTQTPIRSEPHQVYVTARRVSGANSGVVLRLDDARNAKPGEPFATALIARHRLADTKMEQELVHLLTSPNDLPWDAYIRRFRDLARQSVARLSFDSVQSLPLRGPEVIPQQGPTCVSSNFDIGVSERLALWLGQVFSEGHVRAANLWRRFKAFENGSLGSQQTGMSND